jgi:hypothetical protein
MIYEHTAIYMYAGRSKMSEASQNIYMHQKRTNPLSLHFEKNVISKRNQTIGCIVLLNDKRFSCAL